MDKKNLFIGEENESSEGKDTGRQMALAYSFR